MDFVLSREDFDTDDLEIKCGTTETNDNGIKNEW